MLMVMERMRIAGLMGEDVDVNCESLWGVLGTNPLPRGFNVRGEREKER